MHQLGLGDIELREQDSGTFRQRQGARAGLYVIAHKNADSWASPVKIGISKDRRLRLSTLQTGNPQLIGLYQFFDFPSRQIAQDVELFLHHAFCQHRLSGEWFDVDPDHAVYWACMTIERMAEEYGGATPDEARAMVMSSALPIGDL